MHVLVTGGAGYVGSATAAYFLAAGHRVTVFDSLIKGHRAAIPDGAGFVQGDLGDPGALDVLFQTHSSWSLYTLSKVSWIQAGRPPGVTHMVFKSTPCWSNSSRPERSTVLLAGEAGC